jgi:Uma2 family endonuclease
MPSTVVDIGYARHDVVLTGVPWTQYSQTLDEIENRSLRIWFLDGVMQIMSPLPEHDATKTAIGDLIACLTTERRIPRKSFGSATFRREDKAAGAEPDGCFYFGDIERVRGMKRFDPLTHRPPDLWIEVDILNSSVPREPIYARLGVPEVWRHSRDRLMVRLLNDDGFYVDSATSRAFPFLPMTDFTAFIAKMLEGDETQVLLEFREWVRMLPGL